MEFIYFTFSSFLRIVKHSLSGWREYFFTVAKLVILHQVAAGDFCYKSLTMKHNTKNFITY